MLHIYSYRLHLVKHGLKEGPCGLRFGGTAGAHRYNHNLSGSDRRERMVRSVLNGPSVLFYHYRSAQLQEEIRGVQRVEKTGIAGVAGK